jgi:hypothetical protein
MCIEGITHVMNATPNFSSTYEEQDFGGNGNHKHKRNGDGAALLQGAEDIISPMRG